MPISFLIRQAILDEALKNATIKNIEYSKNMKKNLLPLVLGLTALTGCDEQANSDAKLDLRSQSSAPHQLIYQTSDQVDELLTVPNQGDEDTVVQFAEDLPVIDIDTDTSINVDLPEGITPDDTAIWPAGLTNTSDLFEVNYQNGMLIPRDEYVPVATYHFNFPDTSNIDVSFDVQVSWMDRYVAQPPVDNQLLKFEFSFLGSHFNTEDCSVSIADFDYDPREDGATNLRVNCGSIAIEPTDGFAPGTAILATSIPFQGKFGLSGVQLTFQPDITISSGENYTTDTETRGIVSSGNVIDIYPPSRVEIDGGPIPNSTSSFGTGPAAIYSPALIAHTNTDTASIQYDANLGVFYLDEEYSPHWFNTDQIQQAVSSWSLLGNRSFHDPLDTLTAQQTVVPEAFIWGHVVNEWGTGMAAAIIEDIDKLSSKCRDVYPNMPAEKCTLVASHFNENHLDFYANIDPSFGAFSDPEHPLFNRIGFSAQIDGILSNAEGIRLHTADGSFIELPYQETYTGERFYSTNDIDSFFSDTLSVGGFLAFSDAYVCIWINPGDPEACTSDDPEAECDSAVYTFSITNDAECPSTWEEAQARAAEGQ
jgi:hypothetical protein